MRPSRPELWWKSALATGLLALAPSVMAQDLPQKIGPPVQDPVSGHSAEHYGIVQPGQQEASIRSVLSSVDVDRAFLPSSLAAETAYFLVRLFVGGQGAPTDLADARPDAVEPKRE